MLELIATISGLLCVILVIRQNIWNWWVGLVQVLLYVYIFGEAKLYSDMILQIIWIPLQVYGWWKWYNKIENRPIPVTRLSVIESNAWWVGSLLGSIVIGFLMKRYTQAAAPFVDSIVLSLSLTANYLLTKKKINNWYFWFVVDIISVGLFTYKHLYMTAGLYAVYLGLVVIGFIHWKKTEAVQAK